MSKKEISDKDIAASLREKARVLQERIDSLEQQIIELEESLDTVLATILIIEPESAVLQPSFNEKQDRVRQAIINAPKTEKLTLAQKIENVLKARNLPMTTKELLNAVNEAYYKGSEMTFASFSGSFSPMWRDPKKPFNRAHFPDNPIESQYYYGLKEWFEGDKLKDVYLNGIRKQNQGFLWQQG